MSVVAKKLLIKFPFNFLSLNQIVFFWLMLIRWKMPIVPVNVIETPTGTTVGTCLKFLLLFCTTLYQKKCINYLATYLSINTSLWTSLFIFLLHTSTCHIQLWVMCVECILGSYEALIYILFGEKGRKEGEMKNAVLLSFYIVFILCLSAEKL